MMLKIEACRKTKDCGEYAAKLCFDDEGIEGWHVECTECGAKGPDFDTPNGAVMWWNDEMISSEEPAEHQPVDVADPVFWRKGDLYFIRTVTMYLVGELVSIDDHEITLKDAAWVAHAGRFSEALRTGVVKEVEPYPDGLAVVGRGALVDGGPWLHPPLRMVI